MQKAIRLLVVSLLTMMCGCASVPVETPVKRTLPAEVVPDSPTKPPPLQVGDDFRVRAEKMEAVADEAIARLARARGIYAGVRKTYGGR